MDAPGIKKRFIYHTSGVCPPEIHFSIAAKTVTDVRFVGGGCPGNAELVCRLIRNRSVGEILPLLGGIDCRNNTSCPQQLSEALTAAVEGRLSPADSFRLAADPAARKTVALIGELGGDHAILEKIIAAAKSRGAEAVYCLGNLTDGLSPNRELINSLRRHDILAAMGERDWRCSLPGENASQASPAPRDRDRLARLPQVIRFSLADRCGVAFFGDYLQQLPGYSDYEPFALEMNMVCGLTDFMRDQSVFPALEAMAPQFEAHVIVFSQPRRWGHWVVGGRHFISLGPAVHQGRPCWGLLQAVDNEVRFRTETTP